MLANRDLRAGDIAPFVGTLWRRWPNIGVRRCKLPASVDSSVLTTTQGAECALLQAPLQNAKQLEIFQWSSGVLSEERYTRFLGRYGPYAIQMTLCNYGEPLLNPNTPAFIRLAKNYLLFTTLSTNMTARHFDAEAYAASGLDFMTVSLDGATQGVYETFRKKGDLETALTNIRSFVEAKRKLEKRRPLISWQFLAFEHNAHEIDQAVNMAIELRSRKRYAGAHDPRNPR